MRRASYGALAAFAAAALLLPGAAGAAPRKLAVLDIPAGGAVDDPVLPP